MFHLFFGQLLVAGQPVRLVRAGQFTDGPINGDLIEVLSAVDDFADANGEALAEPDLVPEDLARGFQEKLRADGAGR